MISGFTGKSAIQDFQSLHSKDSNFVIQETSKENWSQQQTKPKSWQKKQQQKKNTKEEGKKQHFPSTETTNMYLILQSYAEAQQAEINMIIAREKSKLCRFV